MKLKHYVLVFAASFMGAVFLAGCLNDDNKIPPNCFDGILNNGESGGLNSDGNPWDCDGPCEPCDHCANGEIDIEFGETWVDCGGECGPCSTCNNGILDPGEIGIDCGPTCGNTCEDLCDDGLLNGAETGVDCGGACDACPTCSDGIQNQGEYGVDCGGLNCAPCACPGVCGDGIQNGCETAPDCGGPDCLPCETGSTEDLSYYWNYDGNSVLQECSYNAGLPTCWVNLLNNQYIQLNHMGYFQISVAIPVGGFVLNQAYYCTPDNWDTVPTNNQATVFDPSTGNSYVTSEGGDVSIAWIVFTSINPVDGGTAQGYFGITATLDDGSTVTFTQGSFAFDIIVL